MFKSRRERSAWLATTLLLGMELYYDPLRLLTPELKAIFQADSDQIVHATLADPSRGLFDPMVRPSGEGYTSQFGLHGMVMALASPGASLYGAMRIVTAVLVAAVVATAVIACWRAWGGRAATVLLALLSLSTILNAFGRSTYWQPWTLLLPTLVTMLVWPRLGRGRRKWVRGGLMIAGLVFLKALCGYEYITTVILGAAAGVAFHEFRGRVDRALVARLFAACITGVAGFLAAVGVHVAQLSLLYGDASIITSRASERTFDPSTMDLVLPAVWEQADPVTRWLLERDETAGLWFFRMLGYARDSVVSLPAPDGWGFGPASYGIPLWFFVLVWAFLGWQALGRRTEDYAVQRRLAVAAGVGLIGGISWLLLAFGHSIHHWRLNGLVFYVAFLPLVFAMLGVRIESVLRRVRPHWRMADSATTAPEPPTPTLAGAGAQS